ncbi:tetratricopeptide repeat protein [Limibaculum sp. FT325]|uniref:tetratricopeptide repeat protein n=1 Tax=Thermohalobaculum sediminis TaxID=2939436 RepID=UPI0020BEF7C7|nr:tetratricopeptide repeat protein [Limibaculum sediminis]MCL5779068.1 tetratricopeptide repeat protein [Limibaculum sediminis]
MAVSVPQISREIGAHYILAGSVQRYGARVRVTAQLLGGETGRQLWADRYDRHVEDIFAVQDELTETIVSTVATAYGGRLQKAWQNRRKRVAEPSFAAFDSFLCGIHSFDSFTQEGLAQARMHFEEAIRIQPAYAKALAKLSWAYMIEISHGWRASDEESWQTALSFAEASVAADDDEAWGHWALAGYRLFRGQHALALVECERALALNPNDADILTDYAYCLSNAGRAHEAVEQALRAIHLNPHHPDWYACQLGGIFFDCERYADAITTLEGIPRFEGRTKMIYLAASSAALDLIEEARSVVERIRQSEPSATVESCTTAEATPYKQPADLDRLRRCLAKAGLQPMSGGGGVS